MSSYNKIPPEQVGRLAKANALILVISQHGRRFFYSRARGRVATMVISPTGKVYFIDDYSGRAIRVDSDNWYGWSHGGTLRDLIRALRNYIETGEQIPIDWIGLKRHSDGSNIWGYEEGEMAKCRAAAVATGVVLAAEVVS